MPRVLRTVVINMRVRDTAALQLLEDLPNNVLIFPWVKKNCAIAGQDVVDSPTCEVHCAAVSCGKVQLHRLRARPVLAYDSSPGR